MQKWSLTAFLGVLLLICTTTSGAQVDDATKKLSHAIFKELIEINTTDSVGSTTVAAEAMAKRHRLGGHGGAADRVGGIDFDQFFENGVGKFLGCVINLRA